MEEDIKTLEELLKASKENDMYEENKYFKSLEYFIKEYKDLKEIEESHRKENGKLRERVKELEEENRIYGLEGCRVRLKMYIDKNYIPKSLVKEKIEELDKKRRKFTSDNVNNFYLQEFTRKYTQKSDHDYGVFSTPETITYCTNNELLGRIEALQELLREE